MRAILAAALAAAVMPAGHAAAIACTDQATAELVRRGVARDRIAAVEVTRDSQSEGGTIAYYAWVSLNDCRGYAVVETDARCRPVQVFTKGDCRIPGVPSY